MLRVNCEIVINACLMAYVEFKVLTMTWTQLLAAVCSKTGVGLALYILAQMTVYMLCPEMVLSSAKISQKFELTKFLDEMAKHDGTKTK